jgi:hypothetical protein
MNRRFIGLADEFLKLELCSVRENWIDCERETGSTLGMKQDAGIRPKIENLWLGAGVFSIYSEIGDVGREQGEHKEPEPVRDDAKVGKEAR